MKFRSPLMNAALGIAAEVAYALALMAGAYLICLLVVLLR
jgi:hypothetical protein